MEEDEDDDEALEEEEEEEGTPRRKPRRVWFCSPSNSIVAVTPYAQVYGIHPRYFDFDELGQMKPSAKAEQGLLGKKGLAAAAWILTRCAQQTACNSPPLLS
eukprot:TRINITY_DN13976_c1_g1_i1.p3 TRINITY_DN13976_c1_g1~~TRINITY_DN13976_c1_g1_i1.p3  ORF type:complete len:102 (-),score=34.89 TRINITY_DN13976_c1_g1_i1:275-580(-)